ncbi:hypothetical protein D3C81_2155400 [compost metagenome]
MKAVFRSAEDQPLFRISLRATSTPVPIFCGVAFCAGSSDEMFGSFFVRRL